MNDRKAPYKSYKQAMSTALDQASLRRWKLISIRGDSDFLLSQTRRTLRRLWEQAGWVIERLDGPQLSAERFFQAIAARSLFDPQTLTIVLDAQQCPELLLHLQSIRESRDLQNPLVLIWTGKDWSAKLQKEAERIGMLQIPCDEPAPWEYRDFVQDRIRHYQLALTTEATALFLDAVGQDLFKLDNELNRLSLSLHGQQGPVTPAILKPLLGFLREDHVFKLDQLLCSEAFGKAMLLLKDLLDRGEKPLALLAILALHCRKALQIQTGLRSGQNVQDMARGLRLPPTVVQGYTSYVQRRSPSLFLRALELCHEADRRLKSRSHGDELWLTQILWELRGGTPS